MGSLIRVGKKLPTKARKTAKLEPGKSNLNLVRPLTTGTRPATFRTSTSILEA